MEGLCWQVGWSPEFSRWQKSSYGNDSPTAMKATGRASEQLGNDLPTRAKRCAGDRPGPALNMLGDPLLPGPCFCTTDPRLRVHV